LYGRAIQRIKGPGIKEGFPAQRDNRIGETYEVASKKGGGERTQTVCSPEKVSDVVSRREKGGPKKKGRLEI